MSALGLSADQLAERKLRLHAGDADPVMRGDYRSVWQRFQPGYVPEDLSGEFRVQLGSYTEPFSLAWTMQQTGREVHYFSANDLMRENWIALTGRFDLFHSTELVVSKRYPFMACNLDGMTTTPQGHRCVIDAKHVARWTEAEILRYTPAGTWQATCAGTDWWALAPIVGNKWEPPYYAEVAPLYQAEMIGRAKECWGYIERGEEPPEPEAPVLAPKPRPRLREIVVPTDRGDPVFQAMVQRDNWLPEMLEAMGTFASTDAAAKRNAIARREADRLMPDDVGLVKRGRINAKRDGRGFSMTVDKETTGASSTQ